MVICTRIIVAQKIILLWVLGISRTPRHPANPPTPEGSLKYLTKQIEVTFFGDATVNALYLKPPYRLHQTITSSFSLSLLL